MPTYLPLERQKSCRNRLSESLSRSTGMPVMFWKWETKAVQEQEGELEIVLQCAVAASEKYKGYRIGEIRGCSSYGQNVL